MDIEVQRYLYDIQAAGELIQTFVAAQTFSSYCTDAMLRSAVERQFITMGEALNQAIRRSLGYQLKPGQVDCARDWGVVTKRTV